MANATVPVRDLAQRSRDLIESMLLAGITTGSPESFLDLAVQTAQSQRWGLDWPVALTYWWDLCRLGIIAIVGGGSGGITGERARYIVTERGRRILQREETSPHNGERYLAAVRKRVRAPDGIAMAYLQEGAAAWRSDLNRASVVLVGGACERLIVLLAEAVRDAALPPYSDKAGKMLASDGPVGISEVFDQVRRAIVEAGGLPGDLKQAFDRKLTPIFEHARALRNAHGHPTGDDVSSEEAESGLLLFPGFYALVDRIDAHLRSRRGTTQP